MIWSSHAKRDSADTGYYGVKPIASLHCCPRCPEEAALDHFLDASNFSENKTKALLLRVHAAQLLDGLVRRDVAWPVGPQRSQGLNAVPLIIDNYVVFIARWLVGQTAQLELHKGSGQDHRAERELFLADQAKTSRRRPGRFIGSLVISNPIMVVADPSTLTFRPQYPSYSMATNWKAPNYQGLENAHSGLGLWDTTSFDSPVLLCNHENGWLYA